MGRIGGARAAAVLMRGWEGYTTTIGAASHNNNVYVTVLNIAGRGVLIGGSIYGFDNTSDTATMKLTIDGGVVFEGVVLSFYANYPAHIVIPIMAGFTTSCLLQMKFSSTSMIGGYFVGVAQVE